MSTEELKGLSDLSMVTWVYTGDSEGRTSVGWSAFGWSSNELQ